MVQELKSSLKSCLWLLLWRKHHKTTAMEFLVPKFYFCVILGMKTCWSCNHKQRKLGSTLFKYDTNGRYWKSAITWLEQAILPMLAVYPFFTRKLCLRSHVVRVRYTYPEPCTWLVYTMYISAIHERYVTLPRLPAWARYALMHAKNSR